MLKVLVCLGSFDLMLMLISRADCHDSVDIDVSAAQSTWSLPAASSSRTNSNKKPRAAGPLDEAQPEDQRLVRAERKRQELEPAETPTAEAS